MAVCWVTEWCNLYNELVEGKKVLPHKWKVYYLYGNHTTTMLCTVKMRMNASIKQLKYCLVQACRGYTQWTTKAHSIC